MSKSGFKLEAANNSPDWDTVVAKSPQGTLFSEKSFLVASGAAHHLYLVKQGEEVKAGVALVVSSDGRECQLNDLVIYGGIFFNLDPRRQMVKRRHEEFQITEFVIQELAGVYHQFEFQMSPFGFDIRPFLWFRYHDGPQNKFLVNLRYTSILSLRSLHEFSGKEEESPCFHEMETVRRYSVREALKKGGWVQSSNDLNLILSYYQSLMVKQNHQPDSQIIGGMEKVMVHLLQEQRGALFLAHNKDGMAVYCAFYGWDCKRAYYLFGAGHPEIKETWQGTLVHWHAFKELVRQHHVDEVDLEGVNSPQRGWFKLGFGGDLRPYYHVKYAPSGAVRE